MAAARNWLWTIHHHLSPPGLTPSEYNPFVNMKTELAPVEYYNGDDVTSTYDELYFTNRMKDSSPLEYKNSTSIEGPCPV